MGLFDRSKKEPEIEEDYEDENDEKLAEEKRTPLTPLICPFCNKKIRKVKVRRVEDQDGDDCHLVGCSNCLKVIGAHYES